MGLVSAKQHMSLHHMTQPENFISSFPFSLTLSLFFLYKMNTTGTNTEKLNYKMNIKPQYIPILFIYVEVDKYYNVFVIIKSLQ